MNLLDGKPLVLRTIERARRLFPDAPIHVIAPAFDECALDALTACVENCRVSYGFDAQPLKRMIAAVSGLADDALVLRVDGLHAFFQEAVVRDLLSVAAAENLDLAKSPDNFPPPLTGEVWRVCALRRLDETLSDLPPDFAAPHFVHPKFFAMCKEAGFCARIVEPVAVSDETLRAIRANLMCAIPEDHTEVTKEAIGAGNQYTFHYALAGRYLKATDRVLDVASGMGYGGNVLAEIAAAVTCVDLDQAKLDEGRRLFSRSNLTFTCEDVTAMSFPDCSFDAVTSMETIEHVTDVDRYLSELRRVLKPGGLVILSTPQNSLGHIPLTPAHVHEFGLDELRSVCARHFQVERIIGLKAGTVFFDDDPVGANSVIVLRKAPN